MSPVWQVWLFWLSLGAVAYPYVIYPALLVGWNRWRDLQLAPPDSSFAPTISVILPVHNEASRIGGKIANLLELTYPPGRMSIVVIGDGCSDATLEIAQRAGGGQVIVSALPERAGKAAALNAGLALATGEIVVFTDAGITLEADALRALVGHFSDARVGCVSGEDYIEGSGAEGLYGRLELLLRREEAKLHSIAGASGCFYGQRRSLCRGFLAGMAPDFLSVLQTVAAGFRAISEPAARGSMTATVSLRTEFTRKSRTFLRGLAALFANGMLLNPFRHPSFSFILFSHKLMRWFAPLAMLGCLISSVLLRGQPVFGLALAGQLALYGLALVGLMFPVLMSRIAVVRFCAFFLLVNVAAARALLLWAAGVRQELWEPTRRPG